MPPKPKAPAPAPPPPGPTYTPEQQAERLLLADEAAELVARAAAERREAAALRVERERLNAAWANTKASVEVSRDVCRARDAELAATQTAHSAELKLHKQRVRELLAANAGALGDGRVAGLRALRLASTSHLDSQRELKADKRDVEAALREVEAGHEELVRILKLDADKAVTTLRFQFEASAKSLGALYEDRMQRCRDEMTAAHEEEVRLIDARKIAHVSAMLAAHERAFTDIKAYFNEITHSNLDLIKALKEELDDAKKKEAGDERVMVAIAGENKRMSEPMRTAINDVKRLREEREAYKRDLVALAEAKASALVVSDRVEALRWEHEILAQRTDRLEAERAALAAKFSAAVHEIQQKAGFKQLLLEQKLAAAAEEGERAQMTLAEVLAAANLEGGDAGRATKRASQGIEERDVQVGELQVTVARLASAYDAMVTAFRAKLEEKRVPVADLGFPLQTAAEVLGVGAPLPPAAVGATRA